MVSLPRTSTFSLQMLPCLISYRRLPLSFLYTIGSFFEFEGTRCGDEQRSEMRLDRNGCGIGLTSHVVWFLDSVMLKKIY